MCNSSATSTGSRFNANCAKVFALPLLGKRDTVQNELNKTVIEFEGCINCKLLTLLSHELCLV